MCENSNTRNEYGEFSALFQFSIFCPPSSSFSSSDHSVFFFFFVCIHSYVDIVKFCRRHSIGSDLFLLLCTHMVKWEKYTAIEFNICSNLCVCVCVCNQSSVFFSMYLCLVATHFFGYALFVKKKVLVDFIKWSHFVRIGRVLLQSVHRTSYFYLIIKFMFLFYK